MKYYFLTLILPIVLFTVGCGSADSVEDTATYITPDATAYIDTNTSLGHVISMDANITNNTFHYSWRVLEEPFGSNVSIENNSSAHATFKPIYGGIYSFLLVVSNANNELAINQLDIYVDGKSHQQYSSEDGNYFAYANAVDEKGISYIASLINYAPHHPTQGSHDIVVTKIDANGTQAWTTTYGTNDQDIVNAISIDAAHNVYVSGNTNAAFDGFTNLGDHDIFISKLSSSGQNLWTKQLGSIDDTNATYIVQNDEAIAMVSDDDGTTYLLSEGQGRLGANTYYGGYDIYVTKISTNGDIIWTKQYGSTSDDHAGDIVKDSNGNIYVSAQTSASFMGETKLGASDIVLMKLSGSGTLIWSKQFGTDFYDYTKALSIDKNDSIYIAGVSSGTFENQTKIGFQDGYLIKFDTDGVQQWKQHFGTPESVEVSDMAIDNHSNIVITGYTEGSFLNAPNAGEEDAYLITYDSTGKKLDATLFGTLKSESAQSIAIDTQGTRYITGYTNGNFINNTVTNRYDFFLTKIANKQ